MNQLTDISLQDCSLLSPRITGALISDSTQYNTNFYPTSVISLGDYKTTAGQLAKKLQLLDSIIADYYPELLI